MSLFKGDGFKKFAAAGMNASNNLYRGGNSVWDEEEEDDDLLSLFGRKKKKKKKLFDTASESEKWTLSDKGL